VEKQSIQYRIGLTAGLIILLHIAFSVFIVFAPPSLQGNNKLWKIYRQLVILGPFFDEARIKYSSHLSLRYFADGQWSGMRMLTGEQFATFVKYPWKVDRLSSIAYERHLAYIIGNMAAHQPFSKVQHSASFRELNAFLMEEAIEPAVDSVALVYGLHYYIPENKSYRQDTVFAYTYSPGSIGKPEQ
jgi:hypothetical protein